MVEPKYHEEEFRSLKLRIQKLEAEIADYRKGSKANNGAFSSTTLPQMPLLPPPSVPPLSTNKSLLDPDEYRRYGRQMMLSQIGLPGQTRLKAAKVLIIGVGGLGCPASAYLAGAGIGTLGLVDHDTVEQSNLHRQILHSTSRVGSSKVISAITAIRELNPYVQCNAHVEALSAFNALSTIAAYDLVLDCTDHPSIRYLISDTCVLLNKPLISASALRMDGQLAVLNSPPSKGPCYRCIWPLPPPAESVTSCGDGGILGPVVGVMGVLQALEAIKLLTLKVDEDVGSLRESRLLILSAYADTQWRTLRMRGKREKCISCGTPDNLQQKISRETILNGGIDYVAFCGVATAVPKSLLLDDDFRLDVAEVRKRRRSRAEMILVDVRDETQFGICSVEGSVNVPFDQFHIQRANMSNSKSEGSNDHHQPKLPRVLLDLLETVERRERNEKGSSSPPIVILCRQGNDSQIVVRTIMESGVFKGPLFDLKGGISAWAREAPEDGLVEY